MTQIQFRRGTAAAWASVNEVLSPAEPGFAFDTGVLKLGDGTTAWNDLPVLNDPDLLAAVQAAASTATAAAAAAQAAADSAGDTITTLQATVDDLSSQVSALADQVNGISLSGSVMDIVQASNGTWPTLPATKPAGIKIQHFYGTDYYPGSVYTGTLVEHTIVPAGVLP